jgi:hypothetical protein
MSSVNSHSHECRPPFGLESTMIQPFKVEKIPADGKIEKEVAIVIMRSTMHNDYNLIKSPPPISERNQYLLPTNSVLRKRVGLKKEDLYSKLQLKGDLKGDVGKLCNSRSIDSAVFSNKNKKIYKQTDKGQNPNDVEFKKDFSKLSSEFISKNTLSNVSNVGRRKQTNNNAKNINEIFKHYNLDEPTYSFDCRRKKNVEINLYSSMFH